VLERKRAEAARGTVASPRQRPRRTRDGGGSAVDPDAVQRLVADETGRARRPR